jgi:hypothetical protein
VTARWSGLLGLRRNLWVKLAGWAAIVTAMTMGRREDRACGPSIRTATTSACRRPSSVGNPKTPMTTDPKRPTSHRCRQAAENQKQTGSGKKIRVADFASRGTYALSRGWRTIRRFSPVDQPTNSAGETDFLEGPGLRFALNARPTASQGFAAAGTLQKIGEPEVRDMTVAGQIIPRGKGVWLVRGFPGV